MRTEVDKPEHSVNHQKDDQVAHELLAILDTLHGALADLGILHLIARHMSSY
jgi:hypothetical protein